MAYSVYNEPSAAAADFYTTVQNISSTRQYFGYLPPHGRWLGPFEQFSFWGDLSFQITNRGRNERARRSFERDVAGHTAATPKIAVVKTPAVHLLDSHTEDVKVLSYNSNASPVLGVSDPSWGNYFSSPEA